MSEDNYKETPTKKCDCCNGKGWRKRSYKLHLEFKLPSFKLCITCNGSGVVDLTEDELWHEEQARKDHEADLMSDK